MYGLYCNGRFESRNNYQLIGRSQCQIYAGEVHSFPLSSAENSQIPGKFWSFDELHHEIYLKIYVYQKSIKNK